jgi:flagellar basal body-associated protein FliL
MPEEKESQEKKSGGKKWIFMSVALVVVLVVSGTAAYMFGFFSSPEEETDEEAIEEIIEVNQVINLQPLVANLSAESKMSYARIGITLGIYNPNPNVELFDRELMIPKIKDQFLASVAQKTSHELLDDRVKENLKLELLEQINATLPEEGGRVVEVYFTEFIVQ